MEPTKLEQRDRAVQLLAIYGELLTEIQAELLKEYYDYDLSLSEIGEEKGISRAAISNALHSGLTKMEEYESKLHILENKTKWKLALEKGEDIKKLLEEYVDGI